MTKLIDGKTFAKTLRDKISQETKKWHQETGLVPGLAVVLVGEDPASQVYVKSKGKQSREVGFKSFEHTLPITCSTETLLALIEQLNDDSAVHGILVQLPLPKHIDATQIINHISASKDVDGFTIENAGRLAIGEPALIPCTPLGCCLLLQDYFQEDLSGKHAVILGRSNIVGKPMAQLLLQANCSVTILHSQSQNIESICRSADIIVAATGKPEMVKAEWLSSRAVVIDVGINRIERAGQQILVGDVDYANCFGHVTAITPVPGGVGPMTIACLLKNTLTAFKQQLNLDRNKSNHS